MAKRQKRERRTSAACQSKGKGKCKGATAGGHRVSRLWRGETRPHRWGGQRGPLHEASRGAELSGQVPGRPTVRGARVWRRGVSRSLSVALDNDNENAVNPLY